MSELTALRVFHLACIAIYGGLASVVVWRAPGMRRALAFAMICALFAWWSASLVFAHDPAAPLWVARTAYDVGAVAWAAFAPACLVFGLAFTGRRIPPGRLLAIVAPALLFMALQWTGVLARGYIHQRWGWAYVWSASPWTFLFYAYYATVVTAALVVVLDYRRTATEPFARRQASIVVGMALVPFTFSTVTDVVLPWAGVRGVPNLAPGFLLPWVAGIAVAIVRYGLLEISPETAATDIFTAMKDGVLLVDAEGGVVRWNPAAAALLAPRPLSAHGRLDRVITGAEVAAGIVTRTGAADAPDRLVSVERSPIHDRDGAAIGSILLLRDITLARRHAQALEAARAELEVRVRDRTQELAGAYHQLERYSRALGALLAAVDAIRKGGTLAEIGCTVADAVRSGFAAGVASGCRIELDGATHDSTELAVTPTSIRAEVVSAGKLRGRIEVFVVDASAVQDEERRMLDAVARELGQSIDAVALRQALTQSERLAAVGLLAAGVAHEINNPLAYVIAGLDELRRGLGDPRAADPDRAVLASRAREALEGAQRIARIVGDLGSFARARDEQTLIDVSAPIEAAISIARNQLRHRARLRVELDAVAVVRADPGRLTQVVLNLLVNALQALPDRADAGEIGVRSWVEGDEVHIEVRDDGAGIPPEDLPRVFEPFFSRKRVGEGSGLGLAISHGIVAAAGGRIAVDSQVGVGSRFTITLPRVAAPAQSAPAPVPAPVAPAAPAPTAPAGPPPAGARSRVLIVDDDPMVGRALRRMLRDYDCVLVESTDAAKAQLVAERFDALITDIMMPDATGVDLLRWIEAEAPAYADRVLFMTGGTLTADAGELAARMADRTIRKPFELDEVLRLVGDCVCRAPPA